MKVNKGNFIYVKKYSWGRKVPYPAGITFILCVWELTLSVFISRVWTSLKKRIITYGSTYCKQKNTNAP